MTSTGQSREAGLRFNPKKAKLWVSQVRYVGLVFSADGLNHPKIHAISVKEGVPQILGTVNYLDKFIEHKLIYNN